MMKKVLIFGCGWLGTRLAREHGWYMSGADINSEGAIQAMKGLQPDVVVNAAGKCGHPNIDGCLLDKEAVTHSNVHGARRIAEACNSLGVHLIHISSGCLWKDGTGYTPASIPAPPSFYSETKAQGEEAVRSTTDNYAMVRLRMPIDDRPHPRNLLTKLLRYNQIINEPCSVTTVPMIIKAIKEIADTHMTGTFHVTHPGEITNKEILDLYEEIVGPVDKYTLVTQEHLIAEGNMIEERSFAILESSSHLFKTEMKPVREAVIETLQGYAKV